MALTALVLNHDDTVVVPETTVPFPVQQVQRFMDGVSSISTHNYGIDTFLQAKTLLL